MPRYEKVILLITVGCLLLFSGWFFAGRNTEVPYRVILLQNDAESITEEQIDGWPDSLLPGERIDINTAEVEDLQRLPGIGEKRAKAIADYRREYGGFQNVDELIEVSGIGEETLKQLRKYVCVT